MFKVAWSPIYHHPLPHNHRFPMEKYSLLPEQLTYEGTLTTSNFFTPTPLSEKWILKTHALNYWQKLKNLQLTRKEERRTGFPLSKELIEREITIMNGTLICTDFALQYGVSMNIAGGTHHAFTNLGEGFCLLNDIAIAANYLLEKKLAKKILVIDLDVHQGNGTAQIFKNNPAVFTFSMHGAKNFPMNKEKSDLDIGLEDGTGDEEYLNILKKILPHLIKKEKPDFIFYQCGVDVLKSDKLGRLAMTLEGCKKRDQIVLEACYFHQIPVVASMGGGYSEKISVIIEAHANTFRLANELFF